MNVRLSHAIVLAAAGSYLLALALRTEYGSATVAVLFVLGVLAFFKHVVNA